MKRFSHLVQWPEQSAVETALPNPQYIQNNFRLKPEQATQKSVSSAEYFLPAENFEPSSEVNTVVVPAVPPAPTSFNHLEENISNSHSQQMFVQNYVPPQFNAVRLFCKAEHPIWKCPTFKKKTPAERAKLAAENRLCFSCLNGKHSFRKCPKPRKCSFEKCKSSHNTLLHGAERIFPEKGINTDWCRSFRFVVHHHAFLRPYGSKVGLVFDAFGPEDVANANTQCSYVRKLKMKVFASPYLTGTVAQW